MNAAELIYRRELAAEFRRAVEAVAAAQLSTLNAKELASQDQLSALQPNEAKQLFSTKIFA
jgi:hypothetical protein